MAEICYYADQEYSVGSVIEIDDDEYQECVSGPGGATWGEVQKLEVSESVKHSLDAAGDAPDVVVRDSADPTIVFKEGSTCLYGGQKYSVGAKRKMPNGQVKRCENTVDAKGKRGTGWFPV
ncbi:DUF1496 domain-containing protein [Actinoplanes sp. NPDC048791]|uniref:DUF1496 domain-containing protein n=1 Tax=Actinoplanes sp. NPDC048791 TaxID=3154623 RepID=UPI0033C652D3